MIPDQATASRREPSHSGRDGSAWRDLVPRAASAFVLIALALMALWLGDGLFLAFWFAAAAGVAWEWQKLVGEERLIARVAVSLASLAIADSAVATSPDLAALAVLLGAAIVAAIASRRRAWSAVGVIYAGCALVPVGILRLSVFDGAEAVLWLFVIVWGCDVMAYFGGRTMGGPKLWPSVSPGKTWSGSIAGAVCGALFGVGVLAAAGIGVRLWHAFALGLFLAVVSQGGDLFESYVKRRFGAKDSSRLIPGHGGLMDRLDGFIAAATLASVIGIMRYDAASSALGLLRW